MQNISPGVDLVLWLAAEGGYSPLIRSREVEEDPIGHRIQVARKHKHHHQLVLLQTGSESGDVLLPRSVGLCQLFRRSYSDIYCSKSPTAISPPRYPIVVAEHPMIPNQFAVGLTDGGVYVCEPLESDGQWGVPPPLQKGLTGRIVPPPPAIAPDQPQG
ncbi:hypothetical protein QYF36_017602 [Acer negundo]|nr:hypothetical protein QYF36_017602 [Acer negundo]